MITFRVILNPNQYTSTSKYCARMMSRSRIPPVPRIGSYIQIIDICHDDWEYGMAKTIQGVGA